MKDNNILLYGGILLMIIAGCIIGIGIYQNYISPKIGQVDPRAETIIGSSVDAELLPYNFVDADATTTSGFADGGAVDQLVDVQGMDNVRFNVLGKGQVSSSTINMIISYSQDSVNFFSLASTTLFTTTDNAAATSTIYAGDQIISFAPNTTASSNKSFLISTLGARWMRVRLQTTKWGHLNTGAQAWIEAIKLHNISP